MIYNLTFQFNKVLYRADTNFKIRNLGNLIGYYKLRLNEIYAMHNGLPVSQINPCPRPPSVVIRRPAPIAPLPHHPTVTPPHWLPAAWAGCAGVQGSPMPPVSLRAFHAVAVDRDRAAWLPANGPTFPIWQENHEPMRGVG